MICIGSKVQNCCGIAIGIVTPHKCSVLKNGVGFPAVSQLLLWNKPPQNLVT